MKDNIVTKTKNVAAIISQNIVKNCMKVLAKNIVQMSQNHNIDTSHHFTSHFPQFQYDTINMQQNSKKLQFNLII